MMQQNQAPNRSSTAPPRHRARRALPLAALALALVLAASSCAQVRTQEARVVNRYITPQAGNGIVLVRQSSLRGDTGDLGEQVVIRPFIQLPAEYVVGQIINYNLDNDISIEQVVLFKEPSVGNAVQMLIIDYDRQRNGYIRSWQGTTSATNTATVTVEYHDITHDGQREIAVFGLNDIGQATLDVFTADNNSQVESVITLIPLASFFSETTVGIQIADSFVPDVLGREISTIVVEQLQTADALFTGSNSADTGTARQQTSRRQETPGSETITDPPPPPSPAGESIVQNTYQWSAARGQFASQQIILGENSTNDEIDEQFRRQFFDADISECLRDLDGIWVTGDGSVNSENASIAVINSNERLLELHQGSRQLSYVWSGEFKTLRAGTPAIHLTLSNYNISTLSQRAFITITSPESFTLTVSGASQANGSFSRSRAHYSLYPPSYTPNTLTLDGWFRGTSPLTGEDVGYLFADGSRVIYEENGQRREGSYALSHAGEAQQLEIAWINSYHQIIDTSTYQVEVQEVVENQRPIRRLFLYPIVLFASRADPHPDRPPVELTQTINAR